MGVLCCYFRPKMFSPGDRVRYHSHTLGAHLLATVMGPSPNGPQFCHLRYICPGVLDGSHWHRINAKVASHMFSLLESLEATYPLFSLHLGNLAFHLGVHIVHEFFFLHSVICFAKT